MAVGRDELLAAIETSLHILDDAPPVNTPVDIPGVRGFVGPSADPMSNLVAMARLDEATADEVIAAVIDRFAAEGKGFSWIVGPGSTPGDLAARLHAAGLRQPEFEEVAGMALTNLGQSIPTNPAVRIRLASWEEMRSRAEFVAAAMGHGATPQGALAEMEAVAAVQERYRSRAYLAFADEGEDPAGYSIMTDTDVAGVVWFAQSATLEPYRGRGIYRSLVAMRAADARAEGAEAAVTQAIRTTSAPLLQRMGFTELCAMPLHVWAPEGA
jgi:GNAT superfamily N-acetyltransferase